MNYTFHHRDAVLEFNGNRGSLLVLAADSAEALKRARELFGHMRNQSVSPRLHGEFLVQFKVQHSYHKPLLRVVKLALKRLRSEQAYAGASIIDRYILVSICLLTGEPSYLVALNLPEELNRLRKSAVIAGEAETVMQFVDWDIAIHNFIELNSKPRHRTRVVRSVGSHASRVTRTRNEPSIMRRAKATRKKSSARCR